MGPIVATTGVWIVLGQCVQRWVLFGLIVIITN